MRWPRRPAKPEVTVTADREQQIRNVFQQAAADTLTARMGIEITEASASRVVGTMPVAGNTQPYGLLHGGASCVLAETLGSLGSALHAGPDRITVGIEISATHHRGASAGLVTGVATLLHGGRTMTTYEIVISDEQGRRVCTSRLSCLIRDAVPGGGTAATANTPTSGSASPTSTGTSQDGLWRQYTIRPDDAAPGSEAVPDEPESPGADGARALS